MKRESRVFKAIVVCGVEVGITTSWIVPSCNLYLVYRFIDLLVRNVSFSCSLLWCEVNNMASGAGSLQHEI